jgi:hypothetical protein
MTIIYVVISDNIPLEVFSTKEKAQIYIDAFADPEYDVDTDEARIEECTLDEYSPPQ